MINIIKNKLDKICMIGIYLSLQTYILYKIIEAF